MSSDWDDLRVFLAVAETGSFSGAARHLRLGQPTVSRRIVGLEEELQSSLFQRGAEGATLTAAGERLLPAARRMAEAAAELGRLAEGDAGSPEGTVRIAAPPGLAVDLLPAFAAQLRERHPRLRLDVRAAVGFVDLSRGEADIALRTVCPGQRELVCVAELQAGHAAYATPEYVARLPEGYGPADVDWITWSPPYESLPPRPQLERLVPGLEPIFLSDSYLVQQRAAEVGLGAMVLPTTERPIPYGPELVRLDLALGDATSALHVVCAKTTRVVPRVAATLELLLATLESVEGALLTRRD